MKSPEFDPRRLDVAAFAAAGGRLEGRFPVATLARLVEDHPAGATTPAEDVIWSAEGQQRQVAGGAPQTWLHLHAETTLWRECQRCLQPVALPMTLDQQLRFVDGEGAAAALDADSEEDVLDLSTPLNLHLLIEDELLLALPLVPRHDSCPQPLPAQAGDADDVAPAPNPFAALAALKRDVH